MMKIRLAKGRNITARPQPVLTRKALTMIITPQTALTRKPARIRNPLTAHLSRLERFGASYSSSVVLLASAPMTAMPAQLFINGDFVDARSGETFATINPATEEKIADVASA